MEGVVDVMATTTTKATQNGGRDMKLTRAPVAVGSLADIVALAARPTTAQEGNRVFTEESESERYRDVLGVTTDPVVSSDIIKDTRAWLSTSACRRSSMVISSRS
jgi:glyceraldehyde 3-phosphate dehydrogenase